jgi:single-strand DNA-binding protein
MNSCTFCGRLVADAEMKTAKSGATVCNFRIASDTGWGDNKKTHWLSCIIFGERGQKLQPYLKKGDPITVVGELSPPRTYDAQGETRVAQDLVVREVALSGAKNDSAPRSGDAGSGSPSSPSQSSRTPPAAPYGGGVPEYGDDIPF